MGEAPEALKAHPAVTFLSDSRDPRLALYCQRRHQDPVECRRQEQKLARQALGEEDAAQVVEEGSGQDLAGCVVGLHYSWECLKRLHLARAEGRRVLVHSVLVPSLAPTELLETAAGIAPEVFAVEPQLFASHFQSKGAGLAGLACSFLVAFPVSRPLARLRPPLVVLDGLENPRNVGQILRTAAHLGVASVVASPGAWRCLNGRAARSSMGWLYRMDFHRAESVAGALEELRGLGVRSYAAENHFAEAVRPHEPPGDRGWALVVGSEEAGLSSAARRLSDARVCVPQRGGESLNVAQAAAICLYELGRHMGP